MTRHARTLEPKLADWAWPNRGPEGADKAAYLARDQALAFTAVALEQQGLRALLAKGCAMTPLYPTPWLRPMADMDIVVREDDLQAVIAALLAAGFTREPSARPSTERLLEIALRSPGQQLLLELHLSMDKVVLRPIDLDGMFERSGASEHGASLRLPTLEDQMLLVVLHFAADEFRHPAAMVDLELLVRAGTDLSLVASRAREMGASLALYLALTTLCARLGEQIVSRDLLHSLAPSGLRRRLLATQFATERWPVAKHPTTLGAPWLVRQLLLYDHPRAFIEGLVSYAAKRFRDRA